MNRTRRDLVRVGIFVVVAGALLAGALSWIAGARIFRPVATYEVLFDESVTGLNAGSNVEYQGVVVGRVRDIRLTADLPPKVAVIVDIDPETAVRADTRAALLGSLVTGIKYIQFQGGSAQAPPLPPGGVIPGTAPSLEQFRYQLTEIADRVASVLRRLDETVFTPENSEKVTAFVTDLGTVARSLSTTLETLRSEETGKDLAELVREVSATTRNVNAVVSDFYARRDPVFGGLERTIRALEETVAETRALVRGMQGQVGDGSFADLLRELTAATTRLKETLDVIQSDPSVLLRGRRVPDRERAQ
jgi:phospholipid/cholesterol/gamma-HCH transport system substrate-binding protein